MKNIVVPKYALIIIFGDFFLKKDFLVTFVTSEDHRQFVSRTLPGPLSAEAESLFCNVGDSRGSASKNLKNKFSAH